ncbi:hypothetical protein J4208_02725 [Candidatus Woesearchaeota archaeon]|nr:hypothetical protein [Candidatus Woesearchaeota archaeon]
MAYDLYSVITQWQEIGVYGVLLPFLLIFAISFAILEKIKIFGEGKKQINVLVSAILGLLFLQNVYLIERIQFILPKVAFSLLIFVLFLLLAGVLSGKTHEASNGWSWLAFLAAAIFLIWSLSPLESEGFGWDPVYYFFETIPQWIVVIAIVGTILYFLTKEPGSSSSGKKPKKQEEE